MPRKKTETPETLETPSNGRYENFEFLNLELTKDQREALKKLPVWSDEWDAWLSHATEVGFQISLKVDGFNKCFAAYMQVRLHSHPCYGFILSGRGSTQIKALRQLLYKHYAVLGEDWGKLPKTVAQAYDD